MYISNYAFYTKHTNIQSNMRLRAINHHQRQTERYNNGIGLQLHQIAILISVNNSNKKSPYNRA